MSPTVILPSGGRKFQALLPGSEPLLLSIVAVTLADGPAARTWLHDGKIALQNADGLSSSRAPRLSLPERLGPDAKEGSHRATIQL